MNNYYNGIIVFWISVLIDRKMHCNNGFLNIYSCLCDIAEIFFVAYLK